MKLCVAVLDTMWGNVDRQISPRYFRINPLNRSGKRLLWLLGGEYKLLITNACKELVSNPNKHGKPDPVWLEENLIQLRAKGKIDLLLICGNTAKRTFLQVADNVGAWDMESLAEHVLYIPHPASRTWTRKALDDLKLNIYSL